MEEVTLSKQAIAGSVAQRWGSPDFPEHVFVSLERCVGFGEGCGGVGTGSIVNALTDLESGFFGAMVRIDELVLNIPGRDELLRFFTGSGDAREPLEWSAGMRRALAEGYAWRFAERVGSTRIRWE